MEGLFSENVCISVRPSEKNSTELIGIRAELISLRVRFFLNFSYNVLFYD